MDIEQLNASIKESLTCIFKNDTLLGGITSTTAGTAAPVLESVVDPTLALGTGIPLELVAVPAVFYYLFRPSGTVNLRRWEGYLIQLLSYVMMAYIIYFIIYKEAFNYEILEMGFFDQQTKQYLLDMLRIVKDQYHLSWINIVFLVQNMLGVISEERVEKLVTLTHNDEQKTTRGWRMYLAGMAQYLVKKSPKLIAKEEIEDETLENVKTSLRVPLAAKQLNQSLNALTVLGHSEKFQYIESMTSSILNFMVYKGGSLLHNGFNIGRTLTTRAIIGEKDGMYFVGDEVYMSTVEWKAYSIPIYRLEKFRAFNDTYENPSFLNDEVLESAWEKVDEKTNDETARKRRNYFSFVNFLIVGVYTAIFWRYNSGSWEHGILFAQSLIQYINLYYTLHRLYLTQPLL